MKVAKFKAPKIQDRSYSDLAGLGIEFEEQKGGLKPEPKFIPKPEPPSSPKPREFRGAGAEESTQTLSLKDLKPSNFDRTVKEKQPSTVSIDEMRKSIAEALKSQMSGGEGGE